ncbi:hypothetical protein SANA_14590 [Gottschalkiaceae bacterium SANA]|nr:hypothetical protein SANA_14590 [Gottschalkiaceae bacterium SANA]
MKRSKQILWICMSLLIIFSLRGWALHNQATPLAKRFSSQVETFEAKYGKGEKNTGNEQVLLSYRMDEDKKRFLAAGQGYEDWILLNVVIDKEEVVEVGVVYSKESDGYGSYVEEEWFLERTLLKLDPALELVKYRKESSNEVVAITGATMTSQGVVDAINSCIKMKEETEYE